jgi:small subunit ribosomal protein S17
MSKRIIIGQIHSAKMNKTVVVKVETVKVHPKYHKRYTKAKKYSAHNELDGIAVGDRVEIIESKPFSKTVKWKVVKKLSKSDSEANIVI